MKFCLSLWRASVRLTAGIGALFLLVTLTPLDKWWATALSCDWNSPRGDVLIVLGGSTLDNGMIGGSTYWRGVYAVLCYREARYGQVVLSGGPESDESAATELRRFLLGQGVPESVIRLEDRSRSTRENALFTAELLRGTPGRKLLLTSDYHMFRASRAFRKAGVDIVTLPFPDVLKRVSSWRGRWPAFLDLVLETTKIVYYWTRGWV
jgi:uncharacterized SAM-binding protein YcdF (DUF218 family)